MDFDNPKDYGDTSTTDGLVLQCMYALQVFTIHCNCGDTEYSNNTSKSVMVSWNLMAKFTCSLVILGASRDVNLDLVV